MCKTIVPLFVAFFFRVKWFLIVHLDNVVTSFNGYFRRRILKRTKRQLKGSSFWSTAYIIFAVSVIFLITSFEILILLHGLRGERYRVKAYNEEADHWIINSKKDASFRFPIFDSVSSLYKGH